MPLGRLVVGSTADDSDARTLARRLRDAGEEVVFVGGHQSADQLARTALAEDAAEVVVDGTVADVAAVAEALGGLGADDVAVTRAGDRPTDPRPPRRSR